MWQIAVSAEAVILLLMQFVVSKGRLFLFLFTLGYFAFVWWLYSRPLRRRHTLTETTLTLVEPSGTRFAVGMYLKPTCAKPRGRGSVNGSMAG